MNWEAIGAVGEILGAIGVIITLGYLAIQIRQNTKVTKASTAQQMTDKWVTINLQLMQTPSVSLYDLKNLESDSEELVSGFALWRSLFHQWSNNHYQYSQGVLDEALFTPTGREVTARAVDPRSGPNLRFAWESERYIYNDGFRKYMDQLLEEKPIQH